MACIHCNCGETRILLATNRPRTLTVCCCEDCWKRFDVLHQQRGGPKPQDRNLPALLYTFENSLVIESGDIYFFKLHDGPCPLNAASSCCNTYMTGYFAPYHHNCVVIPSSETGGGKLDGDISEVAPNFMSFRKNKEHFDDLLERKPEFSGVPEFWFKGSSIQDGFDGLGEWEKALVDTTATLQEPIVGQPNGKTFQELIDERGGEDAVKIMALQK